MTAARTTERLRRQRQVSTLAEAARFIDTRGFCLLYPISGLPLESLYFAVTQRHPHIEYKWDEKSKMLWRWKDELPLKRRAFYGKYLRGRGTFISLKFLPHFLSMNEAAVAPGDCERFYAAGRIHDDARTIWESLAKHGPLPTLELRNRCHMDTTAGNKRFKKAALDLQRQLIVVHFGAEQETAAWASGRFELTCRAFPDSVKAARAISPADARAAIATKYLQDHSDARPEEVRHLFGWSREETTAAMRCTQ